MNHNNLIHKVTLRIKDKKNTLRIEDRREASGDGKYDRSQVINTATLFLI